MGHKVIISFLDVQIFLIRNREMSEGAKIAKAAGIITICMVVARILGYVRDALLYAIFGQNRITDIYNAAFSIPDFIYMILIGGALSSAFYPCFWGVPC